MAKAPSATSNVMGIPLDIVIDRSVPDSERWPIVTTVGEEPDPLIARDVRQFNATALKIFIGSETVCLEDSAIGSNPTNGRELASQALRVERLLRQLPRVQLHDVLQGKLHEKEIPALAVQLIALARLQCFRCLNSDCNRRDPDQAKPF